MNNYFMYYWIFIIKLFYDLDKCDKMKKIVAEGINYREKLR